MPTAEGLPANVPNPISSLVGRDVAGAEVAALLDTHRLVTIVGPPGVGKTRLAQLVAAQLRDTVDGGPIWLDGTGVAADAGAPALKSALGLDGGGPLAGRRVLLVVDGAERDVPVWAAAAQTVLSAHGNLSMLVTSREALAVTGERVWSLAPLTVDEKGHGTAVELFAERVAGIRRGFTIDERTRPLVASICRAVDGLPLAIELAAEKVGVLTLEELAVSVTDDTLGVLRGSGRSTIGRHRSLEAAITWTYGRLPAADQAVLRRLSVFAGSCSRAAAEAVCTSEDLDAGTVLAGIARLVSTSLLVADTAGPEARYSMLGTIRRYALGCLAESGEAEDMARRFTDWMVDLAERSQDGLVGGGEGEWLQRLQAEQPNFDAVWGEAAAAPGSEVAVRLAAALPLYWRLSRLSEGQEAISRVLATATELPADTAARLLWGLGLLYVSESRYSAAVPALEQAVGLARTTGDQQIESRALVALANCALVLRGTSGTLELARRAIAMGRAGSDWWVVTRALQLMSWAADMTGDTAAARSLAGEAVAEARAGHQVSGLIGALTMLGVAATHRGDFDEAERALAEALERARAFGVADFEVATLTDLAELAMARGQLERARTFVADAVGLARSQQRPWALIQALHASGRLAEAEGDVVAAQLGFEEVMAAGQAIGFTSVSALEGLGRAALQGAGDPARTRQLLNDALAAARITGAPGTMARALHGLGELAGAEGQHRQAASLHRRALQLRLSSDYPGIADSLEAMASLECAMGRPERAARLLGAATSVRRASGHDVVTADRARHEGTVRAARASLGERFAEEWAAGEQLSVADAVAVASGRRRVWRPTTGWASLTRAERDVVALVAEGLTNRQVGERLVISRRTVQTHLAHIYTKLHLRSRQELVSQWRSAPDGDADLPAH